MAIINLTRIVIFVLFSLFVIAMTEFFIVKFEFDKINNNLEMITMANKKSANLQAILAGLRDLRYIIIFFF